MVIYPITQPTEDYLDAEKTGRCKIFRTDVAGHTLVCAVIYGWTGGIKGSKEAERTDDILTIIRMQFLLMDEGPKLICGDFNATADALPTLEAMLKEEGWTDAGNDPKSAKAARVRTLATPTPRPRRAALASSSQTGGSRRLLGIFRSNKMPPIRRASR